MKLQAYREAGHAILSQLGTLARAVADSVARKDGEAWAGYGERKGGTA